MSTEKARRVVVYIRLQLDVGMKMLFGFQIGNMTMAFVKVAKILGFSLSTRMY